MSVVLLSAASFAQKTESFDIVTYAPPAGWQTELAQDAVQFGIEGNDGGSCLISLFRSVPASSDPKINFAAAWENIVKKMLPLKSDLQMQPSAEENGWIAESGFAQYESDGIKGLVMLVTLTGDSKMINILTLTNTDAYQDAVTGFLDSIVLPKLQPASVQQSATSAASAALAQFTWKNTQNRKDNLGGYGGYSSNTYKFHADGRYNFTNVSFQSFAPKFSIVDEEGTYQVSGNTVTLIPSKAVYHVHRNERTDPPSKTGSLPLERVQYRFEFVTIYDRQRLVLAPSTGSETKRDGTFNYYNNGALTRSYIYDAQ